MAPGGDSMLCRGLHYAAADAEDNSLVYRNACPELQRNIAVYNGGVDKCHAGAGVYRDGIEHALYKSGSVDCNVLCVSKRLSADNDVAAAAEGNSVDRVYHAGNAAEAALYRSGKVRCDRERAFGDARSVLLRHACDGLISVCHVIGQLAGSGYRRGEVSLQRY